MTDARPRIRRLETGDQQDAISLLVSKLPREVRDQACAERLVRWRWQYYENPNNPEQEPILWVADMEDAMAGMVCPLAIRVRTPAGLVRGSWCNDWIVRSGYRGLGIGKLLEQAWIGTFPIALGRGWSERAYIVSVRVGLVTVSGFLACWFVLSRWGFARYLRRTGQYRNLGRLIGTMPVLGKRKPGPAQQLAVRVSPSLPDGVGDLWDRVADGYSFAVERDPLYLKWRYEDHPHHEYQFLYVTDGGRLLALAVARISRDSPPLGIVGDLIVEPHDLPMVSRLFDATINMLRSKGACAALVDIPPLLADPLLSSGIPNIRQEMSILVGTEHDEFRDMGIYDARSWYLSRSDSDLDF